MRVTRDSYRRGEAIFRQGERGERIYLIEAGRVLLHREDAQGVRHLGVCSDGDLIGELAPLDQAPRYASAVCETDTKVLAFSRAYLRDAMQRADPVLPKLIQVLLRHFRASNPDPAAMGLGNVDRELAALAESTRLQEALTFEHDLERALSTEDEFFLAGQAIVRGLDGTVCGYEMLLRWQHPERGLVPPGVFIPMTEARGRITELGEWVLRRAVHQAAPLTERPGGFLSINLGADHLLSPDVAPRLVRICEAAAFPPDRLHLEITETGLLRDPETARQQLQALSALGCRLAIDDFGTGYSSLSHIHTFPFDTLKIDKSFMLRLDSDDTARRLIKAILHLARDLGIEVVAEGVETARHVEVLAEMGCHYYQGFHFHRPTPVSELLAGA